jgi:hypothetical protein
MTDIRGPATCHSSRLKRQAATHAADIRARATALKMDFAEGGRLIAKFAATDVILGN